MPGKKISYDFLKAWVGVCAILLAGTARAEPDAKQVIEAERRIAEAPLQSRFAIDDADPERDVPTAAQRDGDPVSFGHYLMNLSDRAEAAKQRGDHVAEAKYYAALARAVPENAIGFIKLCAAYQSAGQREKAQRACREALNHEGSTLADYGHYAALVIGQSELPSAERIADVDSVVDHLRIAASSETLGTQIACDLAVRLDDPKRLMRCVQDMRKQTPDKVEVLAYEWALALQHKDFDAAEAIVQRARERGFAKAELMERQTNELASPWRRGGEWLRAQQPAPVVVAAAAVLLALPGVLAYRQRRKPRRQRLM